MPGAEELAHPFGTSLFCFSLVSPDGEQEKLAKQQLSRGVGIFSCNQYKVLSTRKLLLGKDKLSDEVSAEQLLVADPEPGDGAKDDRDSPEQRRLSEEAGAFDAEAFQKRGAQVLERVWEQLLRKGKGDVLKHDWAVKAEPEAVFLPDRLRRHLALHAAGGGGPAERGRWEAALGLQYLIPGPPRARAHQPSATGALQVLSRGALELFEARKNRCSLKDGSQGDDYMRTCLGALGAHPADDFELVGTARAGGRALNSHGEPRTSSPCADGSHVTYYPAPDVPSYLECLRQAGVGVMVQK
jgi:hypothetical protein